MHLSSNFSKLFLAIVFSGALSISLPVNATVLDIWAADGWTVLDIDDGVGPGGYVGPGWGGQAFDAEYLFYKQENNLLSIGLQTGFDILDGQQYYGAQAYYAGDLALGFNNGGYNYAIDFGLVTRDSDANNVGLGTGNQDAAGLYSVSAWNNNISFSVSSPFGMDEGTYLSGITASSGVDGDSYFRTATFDLNVLGIEATSFSAHWTMSCGNDAVEGSANIASVPEPGSLLLLIGALFGLVGSRRLNKPS